MKSKSGRGRTQARRGMGALGWVCVSQSSTTRSLNQQSWRCSRFAMRVIVLGDMYNAGSRDRHLREPNSMLCTVLSSHGSEIDEDFNTVGKERKDASSTSSSSWHAWPVDLGQRPFLSKHSLTQTSAVGCIIGFIFGATNIIRYGPGPNGMLRTLGQYMLGSAATFGSEMGKTCQPATETLADSSQLLHVHRHDHKNRQLRHHRRSISKSTSTEWEAGDHAARKEEVVDGQNIMIDDLREGCGRAVRSGFGSDILGSNAQLLPSEGISTAFKSPRLALYDTRYIPRTIKRRCHVVVGRRYHRAPAAAAASSLMGGR
nr:protein mgr2 [Quercus suber]